MQSKKNKSRRRDAVTFSEFCRDRANIKTAVIVLITVVVCVVLIAAALSTRDVFLGDFEEGSYDFKTETYLDNVSSFEQDIGGGVDGSSCLKIESTADNDARYVKELYLQARRSYIITGYIKAENISGDKAVGASIQVIGYNSSGSQVSKEVSSYIKNTGDKWREVELRIDNTSMSNDYKLVLRLGDNSGDTAGVAYFDNVSVRLTSPLTAGTYEDMRIISVIIVLAALLIFFIAYRYSAGYQLKGGVRALDIPAGGKLNFRNTVIVLFLIAFFLRIFLSVTYYQCDIDVNLFKSWGNNSLSGGFAQTYNTLGSNIDYPPLYVYCLYTAAALNSAFGGLFGFGQEYFFTVLIKLPSMLSDIAIGYIIFRYAKKYLASEEFCLFLTAAWLLNPLSLLDSACWGQVDSLLTIFVLGSIIFLNKKNYLVAGIFFGLGVMLKPQMFFFLPVFGYMWLKDTVEGKKAVEALKKFGLSVGGALIGVIVPYIPFMHMGFKEIEIFGKNINLPWIFSLFMGTADHYTYATVNCYNFWFLLGKNWVKDDKLMGGVSLFTWGMIAIVLISLVTLYFSLKIKNSEGLPYLLAAFMFAAVPCFAPRMHERYFFPAVALLLIAAVIYNSKTLLFTTAGISAAGFLSVSDIMMGLLVGGYLKTQDDSKYGQYYWPSLEKYNGVIATLMVAVVFLILIYMIFASLKKGKAGGAFLSSGIYEPQACDSAVPAASAFETKKSSHGSSVKGNVKQGRRARK